MKNIRKSEMIAAALSVIALVAFIIYGNVFNYFDTVVCGCLIAAAVLFAFCGWKPGIIADFAILIAVFCMSAAESLFLLNSFPVWADNVNGITMYNSRGGLVPVVIILVIMLAAAIMGIICCFKSKKGDA